MRREEIKLFLESVIFLISSCYERLSHTVGWVSWSYPAFISWSMVKSLLVLCFPPNNQDAKCEHVLLDTLNTYSKIEVAIFIWCSFHHQQWVWFGYA